MDKMPQEEFPEIANILQYIAEYPEDADPVIRSDYFKVIQKHTRRILLKLEQHPLPLLTLEH